MKKTKYPFLKIIMYLNRLLGILSVITIAIVTQIAALNYLYIGILISLACLFFTIGEIIGLLSNIASDTEDTRNYNKNMLLHMLGELSETPNKDKSGTGN